MIQRSTVLAVVCLTAGTLWAQPDPGIKFIGRGEIAGNLADKSGLKGNICQLGNAANCIPNTTLGGLGSGITYTGFDNVFLATPDRGPFDGRTDTPYLDRFHYLRLSVDTTKSPSTGALNISFNLLATPLLRNELFKNLVGSSAAFSQNPLQNLRFDPEGVVVTPWGTFIVSDEYGPYLYEFTGLGYLVRRHQLPSKFLINNPTADVNTPLDSLEIYDFPFTPPGSAKTYGNDSGRQANRGMEGLAITPDGRYLVGIMQNALIQDGGLTYTNPQTLDTSPSRTGVNNRIFKYDLFTGRSTEYVYVMDAVNQGRGVNDLLAINDHEFLVLERDNRSNTSPGASRGPNLKRLYKIDLNKQGLTDVSNMTLPGGALPATIVPVTKTLFLDLLNAAYLVGPTPPNTIKDIIAEKIEGLAWGPHLPNGHLLLYVLSDNDLNTTFPTQIYAFEVDPSKNGANINFVEQRTLGALFWQIREFLDRN
jgi:hypothetical protein